LCLVFEELGNGADGNPCSLVEWIPKNPGADGGEGDVGQPARVELLVRLR
jgi:hypothetical protein